MEEKKQYLAPMGKVLNLIEAAGFKLEYHYDDLVFVDNTSFLFRFDMEAQNTVYLHFNADCSPEAMKRLSAFFTEQALKEEITVIISSRFQFEGTEGKEEIKILFKE
jgi:hypothetical protein